MRRKLRHLGSSPRAADGPGSAASLAQASTPADNPADKCRNRCRTAAFNLRRPSGSPLDIVSQEGDKILDLAAVHDAVAILLVRYYQKVRSVRVTGDPT